jgi:hypothetical protein
LDIVAFVLWALTAAAGVAVLVSVNAARHHGTAAGRGASAMEPEEEPGGGPPAVASAAAAVAGSTVTGPPAAADRPAAEPLPRYDYAHPPPTPHTRVRAGPGEHPLLEFCHPALGFAGLASWMAFMLVKNEVFAVVGLSVVAVGIGVGLGWFGVNTRAGLHSRAHGRRVPARLVLAHGVAAAATIGFAVVAALHLA